MPQAPGCTDGWRVTGYYTPEESQFGGEPESIRFPDGSTETFPSDFIKDTRMEGWAQTRFGWFLGWTGGAWTKGDDPLGAHGKPLGIGSLATDPTVIPHGATITIPNAPDNWGVISYVADDTGSAIIGKHVDIYCGVGAAARAETNRVTTNNGTICVEAT